MLVIGVAQAQTSTAPYISHAYNAANPNLPRSAGRMVKPSLLE
jgi:hypothetical protein